MSKAGGIKYLLKHGKAPDPVTTRTRMPAMKTKKMARGGLSAVSPYDLLTPEQLALLPNEYRDAIAGHPDTGGKAYFYDPKSQRYTLANPVKTATSGKATANPLDYLNRDGSHDYANTQTDYGAVIGDETASGKSWNELSKEQQGAYLDAVPGGRLAEKMVNGFLENTFVGKGLTALSGGLDRVFGRNNVDYQSGSANAARNWSSTLGYTPADIEAMQDEDQRWSGGMPEGYDPAGDTRPTGYGPDGMGPPSSAAPTPDSYSGSTGFGAGYDPSASGTAAENDARSAGGDYGWANGGIVALARGGRSGSLGAYSDGGQLLRGPGDGVSDSIPAKIGKNQPARLADGEFVIPARIVSELGNGSTEAGSRKLYAMMERIQKGRKKTMGGKGAYAKDTKAAKHLPA